MDVYGYDPFISVEHAWALSQSVQRVGTLEDLCRNCDYLTPASCLPSPTPWGMMRR